MACFKSKYSNNPIPTSSISICRIDGLTEKEIRKIYKGGKFGRYYGEKFVYHLENSLKIPFKEYCSKYLNVEWPKCPVTGLDVSWFCRSADYIFFYNYHDSATLNKSNSEKFLLACQNFSNQRKGDQNPMFGKTPWNKGETKYSNEKMMRLSEINKNKKMSESSILKMKEARKNSLVRARHTTPHSKETIERLRLNTAKLWASGVFNRKTSIHLKVGQFLKGIGIKYDVKEEHEFFYYSLDFAIPDKKIAIECQGTYFHIDPRVYKNGPIDRIQRRNFGRDKAKKIFLEKAGWILIECWELDINDKSYENVLRSKLIELGCIDEIPKNSIC